MADVVEKEKKAEQSKEIDIKALFGDTESTQAKSDHADDKPKETSSSEESEPTPDELKAQLAALTKELNRVRKGKADSSAEVQELREELANVQGQLDVLSKGATSTGTEENRLAKYSDEQLLQGETEWEDALMDEKDAMRRARSESDENAYSKASRNAATARTTLNAIRKELRERIKRVGVEQAKAQTETTEMVQEISELYDQAYETYPELKDKDSALWQAGNEVYNRHPKLMKQLGPLAELVATALAITENPKLAPKGETGGERKARKELLEEINERAEESLIKGKATSSKKTIPDFGSMSKSDFDNLVHKLKMGG